jgi:Cu-Zn family superoxide dismutase
MRKVHLPAACAALIGVAACGTTTTPMGPSAVATLQPTAGNSAAGTVTFVQHGDHMMVTAKVTGLKPNQEHGFHAHEKGDCSSPDGMSTGGHFNPTGTPHGPPDGPHHAGDFPMLKADANGNASATFHLTGVTLGSGPADLLRRGVIVHAAPDDYKTQPTGNSGARIACGVIKAT